MGIDLANIDESCVSIIRQIADGGTGRLWADLEDMRWSPNMTELTARAQAQRETMDAELAARTEPDEARIRRLPILGAPEKVG